MRRSRARFSELESSVHARSLADFITNMSGFRFSVHTTRQRAANDSTRAATATQLRFASLQWGCCFLTVPRAVARFTAERQVPLWSSANTCSGCPGAVVEFCQAVIAGGHAQHTLRCSCRKVGET